MPLPFKAFLLSSVTAGTSLTIADRASLAFERKKYGGGEENQKVILPADADWKHRVIPLEENEADYRRLCGLVTIDGIARTRENERTNEQETDWWSMGRLNGWKLVYH
jgi:hypothetical protein